MGHHGHNNTTAQILVPSDKLTLSHPANEALASAGEFLQPCIVAYRIRSILGDFL
jgi:hypothetical protein